MCLSRAFGIAAYAVRRDAAPLARASRGFVAAALQKPEPRRIRAMWPKRALGT